MAEEILSEPPTDSQADVKIHIPPLPEDLEVPPGPTDSLAAAEAEVVPDDQIQKESLPDPDLVPREVPVIPRDFVSEQEAIVRQYEINEFNDLSQSSLLQMNDKGETESMVKPIIQGHEPVMQKYDASGKQLLNPTAGILIKHFMSEYLEAPTLAGQAQGLGGAIKSTGSMVGQGVESALRNSLKLLATSLTPEVIQNKFKLVVEDFEKAGLMSDRQFLGGPLGMLGDAEDFEERRLFPREDNEWWEDLGAGLVQFTSGLKTVQMIVNTKKLLVPSMVADGLVWDPADGGLFSLFQMLDLEPGVMQDVIDFMDASKHDPNMGRAILAAEGLIIGGVLTLAGIAAQNKGKAKEFLLKYFTPGSAGRKAADPAVTKVAELLSEVKKKWPHKTKSFSDYALDNGWSGPSKQHSFADRMQLKRHIKGELVFPESGTTPKGFVWVRSSLTGKKKMIDDFAWQPDPDAPNFGTQAPPKTLPEGHPLLKATHLINTPAREKIRNQIVRDAVKKAKKAKGKQPDAFIKAGGASAGKGAVDTMMRESGAIKEGTVEINADLIKELLPEYQKFIDAGDPRWADVLHEESAMLANRIKDELRTKKADFVFDRVLPNPDKATELIKELKAAGYKVHLIGVTIDPAEAVVRSNTRFSQNNRLVPPQKLLKGHKNVAQHFEEYAALADDVELYNNSTKLEVIAAKKEGEELVPLNKLRYDEFVAKGNINEKANTLNEILPKSRERAGDAADSQGPGRPGSLAGGQGQPDPGGPGTPPPVSGTKRVTSSPEFKAWFKDSKVVDYQGKPRLVYHGTVAAKNFTAFDTAPKNDLGAHFGTAEQASARVDDIAIDRTEGPIYKAKKAFGMKPFADLDSRVIPVYLNIKNPLRLPDLGIWHIDEIKVELHKQKVFPMKAWDSISTYDDAVKAIEAAGYDGVVYKNVIEGKGDSYIAFHPEQIKSQFNPGTFDPTNPNIMAGAIAAPTVYDE